MRTDRVVVNPPAFDDDLGLFQCVKQLAIEQLITHLPVKRFAVAILPGGSWGDIQRRHLQHIQPVSEFARDELRPVV